MFQTKDDCTYLRRRYFYIYDNELVKIKEESLKPQKWNFNVTSGTAWIFLPILDKRYVFVSAIELMIILVSLTFLFLMRWKSPFCKAQSLRWSIKEQWCSKQRYKILMTSLIKILFIDHLPSSVANTHPWKNCRHAVGFI